MAGKLGLDEPIPHGYKTYSLFLICNLEWLSPSGASDLDDLHQQFEMFGRAIGESNAALWFSGHETGAEQHPLVGHHVSVNVERMISFCQAWKLTPSLGPHIVVTSSFPDVGSGIPNDSAVYELAHMRPTEISKLLAKLTDHLVMGTSTTVVSDTSPQKDGVLIRLLLATQQTLTGFGCAWTFKVESAGLSANLQPCRK